MRRYEKGELAKNILLALAVGGAAVGLTLVFSALPGIAHIFRLFGAKNWREKQRVRQSVRKLEKRGYIHLEQRNGKEYIKITPLGRRATKQYHLEQLRMPKPPEWDRMWRIVMFDIPESKRNARNSLRHIFKELGLHQLQKSVFVYPHPCKHEIDFVANYFNIRKGINYVIAKEIEGENTLKKKFKLGKTQTHSHSHN